MKFVDTVVSKEMRFSIGIEEDSGKFYISIPVSNRAVDYEEYYEITDFEYNLFMHDLSRADDFARDCRARKNDHRLIQFPGSDRGVP